MGKYLISLLVLVVSVLGFDPVLANDPVREVQRELRKRHLFFGADDGKPTPDLIIAIQRYQARKGFPPTGLLDPDTLASLGFTQRLAPPERQVIVVTRHERELRGPNGELLPSSFPVNMTPLENIFALEPQGEPGQETANLKPGLGQKTVVLARRRSHGAQRVRPPRKETNPIVLAYRTVDRAMRNLFGAPPAGKNKAATRRR